MNHLQYHKKQAGTGMCDSHFDYCSMYENTVVQTPSKAHTSISTCTPPHTHPPPVHQLAILQENKMKYNSSGTVATLKCNLSPFPLCLALPGQEEGEPPHKKLQHLLIG